MKLHSDITMACFLRAGAGNELHPIGEGERDCLGKRVNSDLTTVKTDLDSNAGTMQF